MTRPGFQHLRDVARSARSAYAALLAGQEAAPWWDFVVLTAGSGRQAERFNAEIRRREEARQLPRNACFLVVPDVGDRRMGSGGATLNVFGALARRAGLEALDESWWAAHRVLLIHCGGDPGSLPQFSLTGKFFTTLPLESSGGGSSTVFDEAMALSTAWAQGAPPGCLIASGDVLLTFDHGRLDWTRPGVTGVAIRQPLEMAGNHGVYITGSAGRVYTFLQKPLAAELRSAGGILSGNTVALDAGLMRFDPGVCSRLSDAARALSSDVPFIDLYEHITGALTGRWKASPEDHPALQRLASALDGVPFWCCLVEGIFTHIGTTRSFQRLLTRGGALAHLDPRREFIDLAPFERDHEGLVVDSVLGGPEQLDRESVVIECDLDVPVRAARGSILHGLNGLAGPVDVPVDTVVHQVPVVLSGGNKACVVRVYGVSDDPKLPAASPDATWLGRPLSFAFQAFGFDAESVWAGLPPAERTLWNAALFPAGSLEEAWDAACWLMGRETGYDVARWRASIRLSLADSSYHVDTAALADARNRRLQSTWQVAALALARSGADVRPMLAYPPSVPCLVAAGRAVLADAVARSPQSLTEAASLYFKGSLFLGRAGLVQGAEEAQTQAFACVQQAVDAASYDDPFGTAELVFHHRRVRVSAPPRVDLGGGWSDTPPFCLDWGGTVLNLAIALDGRFPIAAEVRRLQLPLLRFRAGRHRLELPLSAGLPDSLPPGSPFAIQLAALHMTGLDRLLAGAAAGLEIRTHVDLPLGSGLGTSSILSAALLRALAEMFGWYLTDFDLLDQVMRLEQRMTTGGGWQDQAGGIFSGAKLLVSGPGLRQTIRVEPLSWSPARRAEFEQRLVLYDTGIQRIAKGLLRQVVGRYLAREVAAVQVLHSIKMLALEMAHALREGEWRHLGALLDRHWQANQILDPNTTNAPINALLREVRPLIAGAKLAGAGGGGFMLLLASDPDDAAALRSRLAGHEAGLPGSVREFAVTDCGLQLDTD